MCTVPTKREKERERERDRQTERRKSENSFTLRKHFVTLAINRITIYRKDVWNINYYESENFM